MLYQTELTHGGDIYSVPIRLDFSVNINPYGTPPGVRDAIREAAGRVEQYPDPYCRELVKALAEREAVPEEWILCGNGASELIYSYCRAMGGGMAVETAPAFSEYALGMELAGGSLLRYPLKQELDFQLDDGFLSFLEAAAAAYGFRGAEHGRKEGHRKRLLLFLCNPNNPDGRNIPLPLLETILAWCRDHGAALFLDECFLDLSDHPDSMKPCLSGHPELFLLKAFTKNYGMAGVRLGYGLCSDTGLLAAMFRTVQPWNVSALAQAAGIAALREEDWILRAKSLIRAERGRVAKALGEMGFRVCASEANYLLFRGMPGLDLSLRKRGIAIRSCENYEGLGEGWYRIGLKLPEENEELIRTLKESIKEL